MVTPATERKAVVHLREAFGMSERRACKAIGCCRMTVRYRTTRADDAGLRQRMREVAQQRRRFFDNADAAEDWFAENDPEGMAFEYEVTASQSTLSRR